jgi:polyhydroxybutyrate depolymerase
MPSKKLAILAVTAAATALAASTASADTGPLPPGACATGGAAGVAYDTGVNCRTVEVDGIDRRYVVYVPRRRPDSGGRAPVVLMFHGSSGTGEQFLRISGWREQADRTGLVAVFPTGLRYRVLESGRRSTKWNTFDLADEIDLDERPPGYPEDSPMPADDVGFVDRIVEDLGRQLPIDRKRVYASGFSNGAGFAARLAVDRSTRIAAAAYAGGGLDAPQEPDRPTPMYALAGTLDGRILEQSPEPLTELPLDPVEILTSPVIDPFIDRNLTTLGLDEDRFGVLARERSTSIRWPATGTGPDGAVFRFAMLAGVGHEYPNGRNNPGGFAAAPEFWEFFRSRRLP